jgi:hypothetical protein
MVMPQLLSNRIPYPALTWYRAINTTIAIAAITYKTTWKVCREIFITDKCNKNLYFCI